MTLGCFQQFVVISPWGWSLRSVTAKSKSKYICNFAMCDLAFTLSFVMKPSSTLKFAIFLQGISLHPVQQVRHLEISSNLPFIPCLQQSRHKIKIILPSRDGVLTLSPEVHGFNSNSCKLFGHAFLHTILLVSWGTHTLEYIIGIGLGWKVRECLH